LLAQKCRLVGCIIPTTSQKHSAKNKIDISGEKEQRQNYGNGRKNSVMLHYTLNPDSLMIELSGLFMLKKLIIKNKIKPQNTPKN
jgi:hypothetical protein